MSQLFTNNAISLLEIPLSPVGLIIQVIPGDGYLFPQPVNPGDFFLITLEDNTASTREIIKIIGRSGDILHIDPVGRGFENTGVHSWNTDTLVDHRLTAFTLNKVDTLVIGAAQDPLLPNTITPANSKISDTFQISYPTNVACKWLLTVLDQASYRVAISEIIACHRGPILPPKFSVYAKTGDLLRYTVDVIATGNSLELNVTNIDVVDLNITWVRINY